MWLNRWNSRSIVYPRDVVFDITPYDVAVGLDGAQRGTVDPLEVVELILRSLAYGGDRRSGVKEMRCDVR